jgi:uncharacterized protein YjbI with pentapeptide repeats
MSADSSKDQCDTVPAAWLDARGTGNWVHGGTIAGQDLHGADLSHIAVDEALAEQANLQLAKLDHFMSRDGEFQGCNFSGADLAGAFFFDTDLSSAVFRGALMNSVQFVTSTLNGADLEDADLTDADLSGSSFVGAKLKNAVLTNANGDCADFRDADLSGADLSGAKLTKASFRGAKLDDVTWDGAVLEGAKFDNGADPRG